MSEYLDVVDSHDRVIGKDLREKIHSSNMLHRGVHIFVFSPEGKLLVEKRDATKDVYPNYYGCSVSEHLMSGESYLNAARRGLKEELGIENQELKELGKIEVMLPKAKSAKDLMINRFYEARLAAGSLNMQVSEKKGIEYFTLDEIKNAIKNKTMDFAPWFLKCFDWYVKNTGVKK